METIINKTNPYRISLDKLANQYEYDDSFTFLNEECDDSVVPALCSEGCMVEPDGKCSHGCPSPLIALGLI